MARLIMALSMLELEEELFKNKLNYLESIRFKWRTISTKIGEIRFKRRLHYNNETQEYVFYVFDIHQYLYYNLVDISTNIEV